MNRRDELLRKIALEETRLAALRAEAEESAARLAELRDQVPSDQSVRGAISPTTSRIPPAPMTNAAKVALFRTLFRGRDDVFPRRWESLKSGKSGYSPACYNEWDFGLCAKKNSRVANRRTTCGDCQNQAFIAVSYEEIALPLQRHAREIGDSVFVDAAFAPWPDQWAFLSGAGRINATTGSPSTSKTSAKAAPWSVSPSGECSARFRKRL